MSKTVYILILGLLLSSCYKESETLTNYSQFVDPFIGTDGKGKTYPGPCLPHGMVQLSPDNGRNGWDWISGYFYPDSIIAGFSHLHLTGTGAGDLYDISFLPTNGRRIMRKLDDINPAETISSRFKHDNEEASPGYYKVHLDDYDVGVELTSTLRTGVQRYSFNDESGVNSVRLDLGYSRNWDGVTAAKLYQIDQYTVAGYRHSSGWARNQHVFFVSKFSEKIESYQHYINDELSQDEQAEGKDVLGVFTFDKDEVTIQTALSSVSIENALANLDAENIHSDFDKAREEASKIWEDQLSRVEIEADKNIMKIFYTGMYHSLLAPSLYSDVDGRYRGTFDSIYHKDGNRYSTFSLWDTYRALHPWFTIVQQEELEDILSSLIDFYDESGQLPVWSMMGKETNMMIGYHAVPVLADAIMKGIYPATEEVYAAMKASAMQDSFGLMYYKELGYVPIEHGSWNVSKTMEYAFDDWCIAEVARKLGKEEDYKYFLDRSEHYLSHFDETTGFFRSQFKDGSRRDSFDPIAYEPQDYCEANAWPYYFYVPQNIPNLIKLSGGSSAFKMKLDELFETAQSVGKDKDWISGYIGQYVHGNEPSHHIPYLYQYVGADDDCERTVRRIMDELYTTAPDGLAGNEDCGQLSAWYLFSALGFYPVNPADGKYILGSPSIQKATIHLSGGKKFTIKANNQSKDNVLVRSVQLNGKPLNEYFISHDQLMQGGELVFDMYK